MEGRGPPQNTYVAPIWEEPARGGGAGWGAGSGVGCGGVRGGRVLLLRAAATKLLRHRQFVLALSLALHPLRGRKLDHELGRGLLRWGGKGVERGRSGGGAGAGAELGRKEACCAMGRWHIPDAKNFGVATWW